jgi:precorrin-4 methylase
MTVFFVGAGPGDPALLTVKAKRLIQTSEFCVFAGSLVSSEVLALLPEDARRYDSAGLALNEIVALYRAAHEKHIDVVRLHTGDPALFGAIAEQMDAIVRGTLSTIAEKVRVARITRTAVILIGRALARGGPVSRLYDPNFGHGFRGKRS